jgi:hypothetical protein
MSQKRCRTIEAAREMSPRAPRAGLNNEEDLEGSVYPSRNWIRKMIAREDSFKSYHIIIKTTAKTHRISIRTSFHTHIAYHVSKQQAVPAPVRHGRGKDHVSESPWNIANSGTRESSMGMRLGNGRSNMVRNRVIQHHHHLRF